MIENKILQKLRRIVGEENLLESEEDRYSCATDAFVAESVPDVVVYPTSTDEVAGILSLANENAIPVTARGAGTGLTGGTVPVHNGIVLCFTRMNRILDINTRDRYAIVQPGVVNGDLQTALMDRRFFYPPDPASMSVSTIGGNIAENAGGPRCLKYGVTADYVLGLEAVLGNGDVIRFGSRNVKDVSGYNLSRLFCGSEGTLGIVTEATLKIIPQPEASRTVLAMYNSLDHSADTVADVIGSGILPAALELMDKSTINVIEDQGSLGLDREAEAIIIFEVDDREETVEKEMKIIAEKARRNGAVTVKEAKNKAESDELWKARRNVYGILARLAPNCIVEDATVPASKVPAMVTGVRKISEKNDILICILGHAGDGNLHPVICTDIRKPQEWEKVERAAKEIFELSVSLGGTLSGEHGIGLAKSEFLPLVLNQSTRNFMARIKRAIDPKGILNPGKFV